MKFSLKCFAVAVAASVASGICLYEENYLYALLLFIPVMCYIGFLVWYNKYKENKRIEEQYYARLAKTVLKQYQSSDNSKLKTIYSELEQLSKKCHQ